MRPPGGYAPFFGDELARSRKALHARLKRVNEALARWDTYDAARLQAGMFPPDQEPPGLLSRDALKSLQKTIMEAIRELEGLAAESVADRRN